MGDEVPACLNAAETAGQNIPAYRSIQHRSGAQSLPEVQTILYNIDCLWMVIGQSTNINKL
jgi:hypothetical protein